MGRGTQNLWGIATPACALVRDDLLGMASAKRPLPPGGRWAGEAGSEEERQNVKHGRKYEEMRQRKISARIPHQSPPYGGASFPPGEAVAAPARPNGSVFPVGEAL